MDDNVQQQAAQTAADIREALRTPEPERDWATFADLNRRVQSLGLLLQRVRPEVLPSAPRLRNRAQHVGGLIGMTGAGADHWEKLAAEAEAVAERLNGQPDERRKRIISGTVAEGRYNVTAGTISRHVASGDLTDHRQTVHATNAPLQVDEDEIAARWNRRPQKRAPAK